MNTVVKNIHTKSPSDPSLVQLVDAQDNELGVMDVIAAHQGEGHLHRAISVFLFRVHPETEQLELLMQQRSQEKIVGAGLWANTVCGNVRPGESYESCAHRRLREELGINGVKLTRVYKFMYQVQCDPGFSEHELDTVYVGEYSGEVAPNPLEVLAVKWVPWEGKETGQALLPRLAPWFEIMMTDQRLMEQTVPFAQQPITPSFLSNLATNTTL